LKRLRSVYGAEERKAIMRAEQQNLDVATVDGFGREWSRFNQRDLTDAELQNIFEQYFSVFPWQRLPPGAIGFDLGCGSGRWSRFVAPQVGMLHCIDASAAALDVAKRSLSEMTNCKFHHASVASIPLPDESMDFAYSLGVLHHVPNTAEGVKACARKLKPGAPFLLYLYYSLDNRPRWFRLIWRISNVGRWMISRLPFLLRSRTTDPIAAIVYWPLSRLAWLLEKIGLPVDMIPLSNYRHRSFYVMRTDALDRFGTRLEQRFSRAQMREMLESAGFEKIVFREAAPYWCAMGIKKQQGAA
jgi:ubiquinone/menaquinone biosynthesis C-methylase UbiE